MWGVQSGSCNESNLSCMCISAKYARRCRLILPRRERSGGGSGCAKKLTLTGKDPAAARDGRIPCFVSSMRALTAPTSSRAHGSEPRPPAFVAAAAIAGEEDPSIGAWMIGTLMARSSQKAAILACADANPDIPPCKLPLAYVPHDVVVVVRTKWSMLCDARGALLWLALQEDALQEAVVALDRGVALLRFAEDPFDAVHGLGVDAVGRLRQVHFRDEIEVAVHRVQVRFPNRHHVGLAARRALAAAAVRVPPERLRLRT